MVKMELTTLHKLPPALCFDIRKRTILTYHSYFLGKHWWQESACLTSLILETEEAMNKFSSYKSRKQVHYI